jgi:hypothetical protein
MPETAADRYQAARNNQQSTQRGSVTAAVNSRKVGPEADPNAYLARNPVEVDDTQDSGDCSPFADEWQAKYVHLPGVYPSAGDERSNRERLLDGDTVEVNK